MQTKFPAPVELPFNGGDSKARRSVWKGGGKKEDVSI